jgi:ATP-dependent DNA helicase RecG
MAPLVDHYSATWLQSAEFPGYVLQLIIPKTRGIVAATDGTVFVRKNAQNIRVVGDAIRRLELDKGIGTFEDDVVRIDASAITNSETAIKFVLDVVPSAEPEDWMKKQNLFHNGSPIVAGVLLFSDEPQAALPKRSAIKLFRYGTRDAAGSRDQLMGDPLTIEGNLYDLIYATVAKTKEMVEGIKKMTADGLVAVTYPDETLHEIITNAVLHRDYSIASDIQVRIYDDRIEVESPGKLAGHVTVENILGAQFARNPKIVRLVNKFPDPPNKDVGEGLNTAFEAMEKMRLKKPEIVEGEHSVIIHIRHTPLASPQQIVQEYMREHDEITNRIGREIAGVKSENVMKDVFLSMNKAHLLERVPGKKGNASAWRKWTGYWENKAAEELGLLEAEDEATGEPAGGSDEATGGPKAEN